MSFTRGQYLFESRVQREEVVLDLIELRPARA